MIAKYHYKTLVGDHFISGECLCEIVRSDTKTYLIKLLQYCKRYEPGKVLRVHKKSIKF